MQFLNKKKVRKGKIINRTGNLITNFFYYFADLLTRVSMLSKQNQKTEPEPEVKKRHTAAKEGTQTQATAEFTKDQIEHVRR